jgi:hypothetical protein
MGRTAALARADGTRTPDRCLPARSMLHQHRNRYTFVTFARYHLLDMSVPGRSSRNSRCLAVCDGLSSAVAWLLHTPTSTCNRARSGSHGLRRTNNARYAIHRVFFALSLGSYLSNDLAAVRVHAAKCSQCPLESRRWLDMMHQRTRAEPLCCIQFRLCTGGMATHCIDSVVTARHLTTKRFDAARAASFVSCER